MSITKLADVPLMYQRSNGVCWYACSRMLYKWSQATKKGSVKNPENADDGYVTRYNNNGTVGCRDNWHLANAFNLKQHTNIVMDYDSVKEFLQSHGPIWAGVQKNWGGNNYGHVVVICGVAETGVFIHDPEPVKQGSTYWLTWSQIKTAVDGIDGTPNPQFLSAV